MYYTWGTCGEALTIPTLTDGLLQGPGPTVCLCPHLRSFTDLADRTQRHLKPEHKMGFDRRDKGNHSPRITTTDNSVWNTCLQFGRSRTLPFTWRYGLPSRDKISSLHRPHGLLQPLRLAGCWATGSAPAGIPASSMSSSAVLSIHHHPTSRSASTTQLFSTLHQDSHRTHCIVIVDRRVSHRLLQTAT